MLVGQAFAQEQGEYDRALARLLTSPPDAEASFDSCRRRKLTDSNDTAIRPFVIGSYVRQDREDFLRSGGVGVDAFHLIDETLSLRGRALVVYQDFVQTREEPTNNNRDGTAISLRPAIDWIPARRAG